MKVDLQKVKAKILNRTFLAIIIVIVLCIGFAEARVFMLSNIIEDQGAQLAMVKQELDKKDADLEVRLAQLTSESKSLIELLQSEQQKSATFQQEIGKIAVTVGTLDKLSKTDSELLQKYSKVYFLNEHYVPSNLTKIDPAFIIPKDREIEIHGNVWPYLQALLRAAQSAGKDLLVTSGYRSFGTQAILKSSYRFTYGAGTANQFSAEQGFSEHQLGTTVDFTNTKIGSTFAGFNATQEYLWLIDNAHRFGFILSYPKDNTYYQYEPWHWRYVGVELATRLHNENKNFYEMDQREIDKYLTKVFD